MLRENRSVIRPFLEGDEGGIGSVSSSVYITRFHIGVVIGYDLIRTPRAAADRMSIHA
jgi:hypothetical protein